VPRFYTPQALALDAELALDAASARHVQVLRMQPGGLLTLFNGQGGEFAAEVTHMGRSEVRVRLGVHAAIEREAGREVHIAIGMPANERMEWLVEKATELGAASIQPLMTERTVLRLLGERADKKQAHWQAIAVAACEQSGRNRVPLIHPVMTLAAWLAQRAVGAKTSSSSVRTGDSAAAQPVQVTAPASAPARCVFSVHHAAVSAAAFASALASADSPIECLCGPEGGLSTAEEASARAHGYNSVGLGPRVLRSETAPLAALSLWALTAL
jgi:16S rRNA (uracil1498-N3)-methyltransferase